LENRNKIKLLCGFSEIRIFVMANTSGFDGLPYRSNHRRVQMLQ